MQRSIKNGICHLCFYIDIINEARSRRGRDRMVVGFTTTYTIGAHRH